MWYASSLLWSIVFQLWFECCKTSWFLFFSISDKSLRSCLRNIVIKISLTNAVTIFHPILIANVKVVSLNLLMFLQFLNVAISMTVFWTWSTSARRMRRRRKCKEWINMEHLCNIIKWEIIPKDL